MNTKKKQVNTAFSQYEFTQNLLNNLQQFNISPIAKLVLLQLSTYYNPKHKDVYPKQKTIASKLGVSERSVTRAISELVKEGLILIECKYTNHYIFTQRMGIQQAENLSNNIGQDDIKQQDNLSPHEYNQLFEPINEPSKIKGGNVYSTEDYKILKDYAIRHNAIRINSYINRLKENGSAEKILKDYKDKYKNAENLRKNTQKLLNHYEEIKVTGVAPTQAFLNLKEKFRQKK